MVLLTPVPYFPPSQQSCGNLLRLRDVGKASRRVAWRCCWLTVPDRPCLVVFPPDFSSREQRSWGAAVARECGHNVIPGLVVSDTPGEIGARLPETRDVACFRPTKLTPVHPQGRNHAHAKQSPILEPRLWQSLSCFRRC